MLAGAAVPKAYVVRSGDMRMLFARRGVSLGHAACGLRTRIRHAIRYTRWSCIYSATRRIRLKPHPARSKSSSAAVGLLKSRGVV